MGVASSAHHLGAHHPEGAILFLFDARAGHRLPEARPARLRIELGVGGKERGATAYAAIDAGPLAVVQRAAERALRSLEPRHPVLLGSELAGPFLVRFSHFVRHRLVLPPRALQRLLVPLNSRAHPGRGRGPPTSMPKRCDRDTVLAPPCDFSRSLLRVVDLHYLFRDRAPLRPDEIRAASASTSR